MAESSQRLSELVAQVAAAYFANSHVAVSEITTVMRNIAAGLAIEGAEVAPAPEPAEAAPVRVAAPEPTPPKPTTNSQVKASIRNDVLISFEDGRPYKMLRRHLTLRGLTPEQYREKWGLPKDYPMTAPAYSLVRSAVAKRLGLGGRFTSPKAQAATKAGKPKAASRKRPRAKT